MEGAAETVAQRWYGQSERRRVRARLDVQGKRHDAPARAQQPIQPDTAAGQAQAAKV